MDEVGVFGLHPTANIAFLEREAKFFLDTLNLIEPSVIDTAASASAGDAQEVGECGGTEERRGGSGRVREKREKDDALKRFFRPWFLTPLFFFQGILGHIQEMLLDMPQPLKLAPEHLSKTTDSMVRFVCFFFLQQNLAVKGICEPSVFVLSLLFSFLLCPSFFTPRLLFSYRQSCCGKK